MEIQHALINSHAKFTNIDVQDIDYDADTGYIYFNVKCDKKTTGALVINTDEKGVDIGIKSDLEYGKLATGDEAYSDSADLVKDGIKDTLHSDGFDIGASCTLTVIGAFKKYDDAVKAYEKAKKDCEDNKKLQTFYSYNTGSHTVGLYDYECIRKVQNWNENGISEVVGASGKSNDDIYNSLTNEDGYRKDVVRIIGEELCNDEHEFDYLEKGADGDIGKAYIEIKKVQDTVKRI